MNGCPENKTTGNPIIYGHKACPIVKRQFIRWASTEFVVVEKNICEKCNAEFIYETEEVQISAKAG